MSLHTSRLGVAAAGLAALVVLLAGCATPAAPPAPLPPPSTQPAAPQPTGEPIKIGAILSLTGPGAPLGTPEGATLQMLEKSYNDQGGVNGRPLKIIIIDDQSKEEDALTAAKQLIESDKVVACLGPSTSPTTMAIMPTFEKAQIPLISCAAAVAITQPVQKYIFSTAQPDTLAVAKLLDYLKTKGYKQLAVLADSNTFGQSGVKALQDQAPKKGMTIVDTESFGTKDPTMKTQLTTIKDKHPEALICWGTNPGPAAVAKDVQALKLTIPLFMSHGVSSAKFIELAGAAAEGVILPSGRILVADQLPATDKQKPVLDEYTKAFAAANGGKLPDHFGGHAWDALHILVAALKTAGPDPAKLEAALEQTKDFVGVSGIFTLSPTDHNGLTKDAFVLVTVKDGKWKLAQ